MSRRQLLGVVFAAPAAVALPVVAAPATDAALLADCARWHELKACIDAPENRHLDANHDPKWGEWMEVEGRIEKAAPSTPAGMVAMARIALTADADEVLAEDWASNTSERIAFRILSALASEA